MRIYKNIILTEAEIIALKDAGTLVENVIYIAKDTKKMYILKDSNLVSLY